MAGEYQAIQCVDNDFGGLRDRKSLVTKPQPRR
jgi:hypothetical protein